MVWYLVALLLGWLLTPLLFDLGFGLGSTAIIVASLYFTAAYIAPRVYLRYVYPPKAHRVLLALVNPLLKAPQGVPASLPLLERMNAATRAKDWSALRGMLSPDFAWVDGYGKRHGTKTYCCQLQNTPRIYPVYEQETREVLADPYDPNVLYVLSLIHI